MRGRMLFETYDAHVAIKSLNKSLFRELVKCETQKK